MTAPPTNREVLDALTVIVGEHHVLTGEDVGHRWDGYPPVRPMDCRCIVRPATTDEVAAILRYCNYHLIPVVAQGGRTGLSGGASVSVGDVALSLERFRAIGEIDPAGMIVEVEAGVPLEALQQAVQKSEFCFGVDLGARGSATIGGMIATNAGGNAVMRYGMMREQVLGLEAVLADGTILTSNSRVLKNNTGYDLKQLFIGSEGTLGVVTRATLRLRSAPSSSCTAFAGLATFEAVLALLRLASSLCEGALSTFEVMWPGFVHPILQHGNHLPPLANQHKFYVLLEVASRSAQESVEHLLNQAIKQSLIQDAVIAQNTAQAEKLWALRDDIDALIAVHGPAFLYDVSIAQSAMESYLERVERSLRSRWPDVRVAKFGHLADGNIHLCIHTGSSADHAAVDVIVYRALASYGGSISAEHGIGLEKRSFLDVSRNPSEIALMRNIKKSLDPRNILNPGKIFL
jgi:FAD/FMN-containing dehydrogenase